MPLLWLYISIGFYLLSLINHLDSSHEILKWFEHPHGGDITITYHINEIWFFRNFYDSSSPGSPLSTWMWLIMSEWSSLLWQKIFFQYHPKCILPKYARKMWMTWILKFSFGHLQFDWLTNTLFHRLTIMRTLQVYVLLRWELWSLVRTIVWSKHRSSTFILGYESRNIWSSCDSLLRCSLATGPGDSYLTGSGLWGYCLPSCPYRSRERERERERETF